MGVKCLAQEHNAVPRPGLDPGPFDPESSALTIRPPRFPLFVMYPHIFFFFFFFFFFFTKRAKQGGKWERG